MIELKITVEQTETTPTIKNPLGLDFNIETNYETSEPITDFESKLMCALAMEIEDYVRKCRDIIKDVSDNDKITNN